MTDQPERIGRYEVIELAGRGAMGRVYRARDPLIGRVVAIKVVALSALLGEEEKREFRERFFREAQAAGGLHHPSIVTIYDVGEWEGVPYMAQEFVEGTSLSRLLKESGPLTQERALPILRQMADALHYAHGLGVVHRDIKPDNILIDEKGRAVLTDFGVARLAASDLTRTGEVLGTPHFMSPEQVMGQEVDGRSDLFSLGVVLYLMISGQRPFHGETISSVCYQIVHAPPKPLPDEASFSPGIRFLLDRLLAKDPAERFQSGGELVEAIDGVLSGTLAAEPAPPSAAAEGPVQVPTTTRVSPPIPAPGAPAGTAPAKRRRGLAVGLIVTLGALVGLCLLGFVVVGRLGKGGAKPVPVEEPAPPPPEGTPVLRGEPKSETAPAEARTPEVPVRKPAATKTEPPPAVKPRQPDAPSTPETKPEASASAPAQPAPAAPKKIKKAHLGLIVEGPLPRGEIKVFANGELVLETPFRGLPDPTGRSRGGFRLIQHLALPPASYVLRFQILSPAPTPFMAETDFPLVLEEGSDTTLKVEPKRMPARIKITRLPSASEAR
ncbi:MAG: serine/threonine-protein kinase [Acidobacteriota bacterium]